MYSYKFDSLVNFKIIYFVWSIILKYRKFKNELIEKYTYKAISKDGKVA